MNDPILTSAIEKLARAVPRALLVGGYVRDELLGVQSKDADIEVFGVEPKKLIEIVSGLFGSVDVTGESFGVLKVFLENEHELDIAIPRRESKQGAGHKGFMIDSDPSMSVEEALRRRDFTINAIARDALTGGVIDPFHGADDLRDRVLRVVDEKTFVDDPLRVYRGVQFAARFELTVEPKTFELMKTMVGKGELAQLSKERVTDEWKKLLLKANRPSVGLGLMRELGIVEKYYPELFATIGTPQEPEWHPEGDVWIHTLMVTDEAARIANLEPRTQNLLLILSSFLHDFGKPLTTKIVDGKIRSLGHEEAGVEPIKSFLGRFTFGNDIERDAVLIEQDHLKPGILYRQFQKGEMTEVQYANAARRLLKRLRGVDMTVFLAVCEADQRGRGKAPYRGPWDAGDFFKSIVRKYELEDAAKTMLLTGQELIDEFGLQPGKALGDVLKLIEQARDDGRISTRDEAKEFMKTLV